jgi:hypothetical protein
MPWIADLGLPRSASEVLAVVLTRREPVALRDVLTSLRPAAGLSERDIRDLL